MIKSDKGMKNHSTHRSNLLKAPIKCHICEYLSRIGNPVLKRKIRPWKESNPSQK